MVCHTLRSLDFDLGLTNLLLQFALDYEVQQRFGGVDGRGNRYHRTGILAIGHRLGDQDAADGDEQALVGVLSQCQQVAQVGTDAESRLAIATDPGGTLFATAAGNGHNRRLGPVEQAKAVDRTLEALAHDGGVLAGRFLQRAAQ